MTTPHDQTTDCGEMAGIVAELAGVLSHRGLTVSVAESCSGGLLAKLLTDRAGSSSYFLAGVVAYSNEAKSTFLGVQSDLVAQYGAVSPEVAAAMAEGMRARSGSDLSLSITGIAGPDGGSPEKPVGTVYLGIADRRGCDSLLLTLSGSRDRIRTASVRSALDLALRHVADTPKESA